MERPHKRRRVSPTEEAHEKEKEWSPSLSPERETGDHMQAHTSTLSRIRSKPVQHAKKFDHGLPSPPTSLESQSDSPFSSLDVAPWLTTSLAHLSIQHPTRIQSACIPPILAGRDCIGGSQNRVWQNRCIRSIPIIQKWAAGSEQLSICRHLNANHESWPCRFMSRSCGLGSEERSKMCISDCWRRRGKDSRRLELEQEDRILLLRRLDDWQHHVSDTLAKRLCLWIDGRVKLRCIRRSRQTTCRWKRKHDGRSRNLS